MDEKAIAQAIEKIVRDLNVADKKESGRVCSCAKHKITLERAKKLAEIIENKASEMGVKVVVAVADKGGNPIYIGAMDDAYLASWDVAKQKAYTSVALKMPTSKLAALAAPGGDLYGIQFTNQGKIVIFGGGEPLEVDGKIVGGLGVSGSTLQNDTYLASFGKEKFKEII